MQRTDDNLPGRAYLFVGRLFNVLRSCRPSRRVVAGCCHNCSRRRLGNLRIGYLDDLGQLLGGRQLRRDRRKS